MSTETLLQLIVVDMCVLLNKSRLLPNFITIQKLPVLLLDNISNVHRKLNHATNLFEEASHEHHQARLIKTALSAV